MAGKKMPWIRLYTEMLHDPKIRRLTVLQKWIWVGLLLLAGDSPKRGKIFVTEGIPFYDRDIAKALDLDQTDSECNEEEWVLPALEIFKELRMIEVDEVGIITVVNFNGWQYDNPSDAPERVAERVAKSREKARNEDVTTPCNDNVTKCNEVDTDTEEERDTESDTDTECSPKLEPSDNSTVKSIFGHWNEKDNLINHRQLTDSMKKHINARLSNYSVEEITQVIDNYSTILAGDEYILDHKWTLAKFMEPERFDKFLTASDPFTSYKKFGEGGKDERRPGFYRKD